MHVTYRANALRKEFLDTYDRKECAVHDLGCGMRPALAHAVNIDGTPAPCVDIVADLQHLPLPDESADAVYMSGVLEHLRDPVSVVGEIHRVLKPGGAVYADVVFVNRYHTAPGDYQRLTLDGLRELFREYHDVKTGILAGPASATCDILRHFLSLLFSVRSHGAYLFLYHYVFGYLLWPLKFLDGLLNDHTDAVVIAMAYCLTARKPER